MSIDKRLITINKSTRINLYAGGGILKILRIPAILLAWFSVFTTATAIGFLDATLEPHLRPVNQDTIIHFLNMKLIEMQPFCY